MMFILMLIWNRSKIDKGPNLFNLRMIAFHLIYQSRYEKAISKMCRIKIQVEFLQTFSFWKVVKYAKHTDLGVIGPLGPLHSVTVKILIPTSRKDR